MSVAVGLISLFTLIFAFAGYMAVVTSGDYSANPLKWRSERHRRLEVARVLRISALEHDLGYTPCSDDNCYTCKRTIFSDDGRKYVMKSPAMPSSKDIKKAVKKHRAAARKAV